MSFDPNWLETRYRFDSSARKNSTEKKMLNHFSSHGNINILDIGAGTGNNVRYYSPFLPQNQSWLLLDSDPLLNSQSLVLLSQWAKKNHWPYQLSENELQFQISTKTITVKKKLGSLLELNKIIDLAKVNLITANAVFDLFSSLQWKIFLNQLTPFSLPLLATLNYSEMSFFPFCKINQKYIHLYNDHMTRKQKFGKAMGASCAQEMSDILTQYNYNTITEQSNWIIDPKENIMLNFLIHFMEKSVDEMISSPLEKKTFHQWIEKKRKDIKEARLKAKVQHIDIFAW